MRNIGIFSFFRRNPEENLIKEISLLSEDYNTTLMKQRALDVAIGTVARDLSLVEWKTFEKGKFQRDNLYYHLNFEPNVNQNATEFWEEVVRKLFYDDSEVLIIITADDQFVVADNFNMEEYVLKENKYTDITRDNFTLRRSYYESEVIHLKYQNLQLKTILRELDDSYGKLFSRLVQVSMRTNQIRGTAKLSGPLAKDEDATKFLQSFVDKIFKAFEKKSVAVVPLQDGMDYDEVSREANTRSNVDELNKVSKEYLKSILEAIGIHPSIVSGDMADVEQHQKKYLLNVINPLVKQVADEINRKFFGINGIKAGNKLVPSIVKLKFASPFDMAKEAEKLIGTSFFTPNEAREHYGLDRVEGKEHMDQYYMSKNFARVEAIEGGDDNKQKTSENDD